jgi:hypothetical protein
VGAAAAALQHEAGTGLPLEDAAAPADGAGPSGAAVLEEGAAAFGVDWVKSI